MRSFASHGVVYKTLESGTFSYDVTHVFNLHIAYVFVFDYVNLFTVQLAIALIMTEFGGSVTIFMKTLYLWNMPNLSLCFSEFRS